MVHKKVSLKILKMKQCPKMWPLITAMVIFVILIFFHLNDSKGNKVFHNKQIQ